MSQLGIPVNVSQQDIARKKSFGASLILCAELAGYDLDKELQMELKADKAQFSRWKNDAEGIKYDKLKQLMDFCGNDAPLLWLVNDCGYDISSLRKKESETERQLRIEKELTNKLQQRIDILEDVVGMKR